jgi:hypothetical protein
VADVVPRQRPDLPVPTVVKRAEAAARSDAARRQAANALLAAGARLAAVDDRIEDLLASHRRRHRPFTARERAHYEALVAQGSAARERLASAEQRFRELTRGMRRPGEASSG